MNEFYNPNQNGGDPAGFGDSVSAADSVTFDEPAPEINIVVDDGGYCRQCGSRLEPGDIFCSKCGARTDSSTAAQTRSRPQPEDLGKTIAGVARQGFNEAMQELQALKVQQEQHTQQAYQVHQTRQAYHAQQTQQMYQAQQTQQPQVINNYYYNSNNNVNSNNTVNSNNAVNTNVNYHGKLKNKHVALILCILFGWCGAHRYYEGKIASGILWTFTAGLGGIGWLIDTLILLFKPRWYEP